MRINTGIKEQDREQIAQGLSHLLADSYTLYLKTHNYHWNVTGPMFRTLHLMFEEQYNELFLAVDQIAERIRSLGTKAPGSYTEFSSLSKVKDDEGEQDATAMLHSLINAHETVIRTARETLPQAEAANDQVSLDLLTQRLEIHEKTAWMLRSLLA
jgi:starvation-inducible DNA-binding protein